MKKFLLPFYACLMILSIACNNGVQTDDADTTDVDETEAAPAETPDEAQITSGKDYEITVIDPAPKSPRKQMSGKLAGGTVTVNYGSPKVKGRIIWGGLEEYGTIWRAGANEATTFETTSDFKIQGEELPAGKYSFFLIPQEEGPWTAVFNSVYEQWGAYEYDDSKDVLRVGVDPVTIDENQESLDYMIEGGAVVLRWAKISLGLTVE